MIERLPRGLRPIAAAVGIGLATVTLASDQIEPIEPYVVAPTWGDGVPDTHVGVENGAFIFEGVVADSISDRFDVRYSLECPKPEIVVQTDNFDKEVRRIAELAVRNGGIYDSEAEMFITAVLDSKKNGDDQVIPYIEECMLSQFEEFDYENPSIVDSRVVRQHTFYIDPQTCCWTSLIWALRDGEMVKIY